jgi:hypothetical protein
MPKGSNKDLEVVDLTLIKNFAKGSSLVFIMLLTTILSITIIIPLPPFSVATSSIYMAQHATHMILESCMGNPSFSGTTRTRNPPSFLMLTLEISYNVLST